MIQQKDPQPKQSYHFLNIQSLLSKILLSTSSKFSSLLLTKRTAQIVYSILSDAQIIQCGYTKIIRHTDINPYMQYQDITLVLTLSGQEDYLQVSEYSKQVDKVHIINLGICNKQGKQMLKKLQFKQKNSIKGYKQQNLDFYCHLQNCYILTTRPENKNKSKQNKKFVPSIAQIEQKVAIDRLCTFLLSYQNCSIYEIYYPKNRKQVSQAIRQKMQQKISVLTKYNYAGLAKNQGISSYKTKVIILQRTQQISPYILSLYYGPLAQQLNITNTCRLSSVHSLIYNSLYSLDILSAGEQLLKLAQQISSGKQKSLNTVNLTEAKKLLQKAYNPNISKQQLQYHQTLCKQIQHFMVSNCPLLTLQQSIANKIDENGQKMKAGRIVQSVMQWCLDQKNQNKYQRYLGLVMLAVTVQSFWWYQKNQLISGIADKDDRQLLDKYIKKCKQVYKIKCLQEKPPKIDQDGGQIRQQCFRHEPSILKQFTKLQQQIKQNKLIDYQLLKINPSSIEKSGANVRTVVYINAMLLALKKNNVQFICKDIKNTKQWIQYQLYEK